MKKIAMLEFYYSLFGNSKTTKFILKFTEKITTNDNFYFENGCKLCKKKLIF